jgi:PAS domain S-box-containing protein
VILVEDCEGDALLLLRELRQGGYDPISERVETASELAAALDGQRWDVIISDYRMPQFSGLAALKLMQGRGLDLPFILVSGAMGEEIAVGAIKAGAHDYLTKGSLARLAPAVERELRDAEARRQRKWADTTLRESEERFRLLVDGIPDYAIFMLNADGIVTTWNTGATRITGYESGEVVSKHFSLFFPKVTESGRFARELEIARVDGRFEEQDWRMRKDGSCFWANVVITALRDEAGNIKGFSKITRDLTEQKRAEDEIRTLNQELETRVVERTAELRRTVGLLETEIAERLQLERDILEISENEKSRVGQDLHDGLCQTLTGIGLITKLLQHELEDEKLPFEARKAAAIVNLLQDAGDEARNLAMGMYPVNIEEYGLISALEILAADMARRFQIRCNFKCPYPVVLADNRAATHVYRITQEAVSNAYKHGKAKTVAINLTALGGRITLKIEDDGEGLLTELNPPGMGLKTMKYRARAIGGTLEIQQRRQRGLMVICFFSNQQRSAG